MNVFYMKMILMVLMLEIFLKDENEINELNNAIKNAIENKEKQEFYCQDEQFNSAYGKIWLVAKKT